MSLAGCQINPIDVNFHLQKSLEFFGNSTAISDPIRKRGWKVPSLMPIRVKCSMMRSSISERPESPMHSKKSGRARRSIKSELYGGFRRSGRSKGQLISKWLFGILNSPKKMNKKNSTLLLWYLRSTCLRSFFGRNWSHQNYILKLKTVHVF